MATLRLITCGFSCQFVETIPEDLLQTECSICLHILRDPHMVDCCGYRFCKACIEPLISAKRCPLCNCNFSTVVPDKLLLRTLNQKRVYCTHKEIGCKWIGELASLDKHINAVPDRAMRWEGCPYLAIECIYCRSVFLRYQQRDHELQCPQRPKTCVFCGVHSAPLAELPLHWEVCEHYPIKCTNGCDTTVKRKTMTKHLEKECLHTIIECDFSYAGCKMKLPRMNMSSHFDEAIREHVRLLSEFSLEQRRACQRAESIASRLKSEIDDIRKELTDKELELQSKEEEITECKASLAEKDHETLLIKKLCEWQGVDCLTANHVLVSNFSVGDTTEQMIKSLFGNHGRIRDIELYPWEGIAVVEYCDPASVDRLFLYKQHSSKGIKLRGAKLHCIRLVN